MSTNQVNINNSSSDDEGRPIGPKPEHESHKRENQVDDDDDDDDDKKTKNLYLLNPIAAESATGNNNNKNYYCPSTPPQRATTNPPVNNKNNTKTSSCPEAPQFLNGNNINSNGYLLGNSPSSLSNNNNNSKTSSIPHQLDNKQIAELLRQQDPRFIRLVIPNENNNNNDNDDDDEDGANYDNKNSESESNYNDNKNNNTNQSNNQQQQQQQQQRLSSSSSPSSGGVGGVPVVTIYENPEQAQPTADELKQQQKIERIARHYGEQARDHGQQVPLIKPRYGPYRRNKESIRVSTNLTLGQQHNNASELFKSGGSFGVRPEKMVVQCGVQHYVDELHFDTPYAMFRTKDGKIETRSVGWSKRGDFVVERHDLILTSDYCYSDSDSAAAFGGRGIRSTGDDNKNNNKNNNNNNIFGKIEKPKRLAEKSSETVFAADRHHQNDEEQPPPPSPSLVASDPKLKTRKVLQVAHTFFDKPVCLDPVAPKPREVVSDGELRQASKNLWRRKYPGVRCPKNRKIRNRLMNDYFVTEHTRPMQLYHANNKSNRNNNNNNNSDDNNDDDDDEDEDDVDQFQNDSATNGIKKRSKRHKNNKKIFSFTPESLPVGFVEFADKSEKQQQQIMDRLMKPTNENNFQPFSSGGGLQNNSTLQHQNKRPDSDSAEGRWNGLPQKHKQEISHALTRTDFMPGFVRDVEQQIRNFLKSWNDYYYFAQHHHQNSKKNNNVNQENNAEDDCGCASAAIATAEVNKPEPYFDVLCRDGYGRLMVHILAQFYLLTSQSHDRVDNNNNSNSSDNNNKRGSTQNNNSSSNNNNREFQRVTRVMLTSQKMKPPVVPMSTLCALFMLIETPSLTPKTPPIVFSSVIPPSVSPKNTFVNNNKNNNNNNNTSKTGTPTTPGSGQSFSIGNAAIGTNVANSKNSKDKNIIISTKKSTDQNEPTVVVTVNQSKNISPAFTSSDNNRFGTLIGQGHNTKNRNNNDDDETSSSDSDDEGSDGYDVDGNKIISSKQQKRFRKKKSLQFSGATRRAILPLLNGQ